ncbi:MAG: polysaccharide biosynthesis/export family protein [Pseudomonadota bacterium]
MTYFNATPRLGVSLLVATVLAVLSPVGAEAQTQSAQSSSEAYRLTVGDRVSVIVLGEDEVWEATVDLDGVLRLPLIGRLKAEGVSLDEAEAAIKDTIADTGVYVSPNVSVSILDYAPVLVSGAVRAPGTFPFRANMTVEAAVGLAGGPAIVSSDDSGALLTARTLAGDLVDVETNIQQTAIKLARVEAQLEDQADFDVDLTSFIPSARLDEELVAHIISRERAILANVRESSKELIQLRNTELEETENQIQLLLERRDVQNDLIALQVKEREIVEDLRTRGLQTRGAISALDRTEASSEARLLEIDAALSQTRAQRADIARALTQFRLDQRVELLANSNRFRGELELLLSKRETLIEKSFLLGDTFATALQSETDPQIVFSVRRRQDGTVREIQALSSDQVRPGDVIQVGFGSVSLEVEAAALQGDTEKADSP